MKQRLMTFVWVALLLGLMTQRATMQDSDQFTMTIQPGDSWAALSYRFQVDEAILRAQNLQMNTRRQPAVGTELVLPASADERYGHFLRPMGSLLAPGVALKSSPWQIAIRNNQTSPYRPMLAQPIYVPDKSTILRELPAGFSTLELSQNVGVPGQAVGLRAKFDPSWPVTAVLGKNRMILGTNDRYLVALTAIDAFAGTHQPELIIQVGDAPPWRQPWQFREPTDWGYQQLTLTGAAAQIDQQSIDEEQARLDAIWTQNSGGATWDAPFQLPIDDYQEISASFGLRRSYNGGPYRTYHEGVDFVAYGGTPVLAPAGGTIVVAEILFVRGGAILIDHGLGVYSGFYHLSALDVSPGSQVTAGQKVGEVGTTGLSTGNHLHWDLLVDGIWVDGMAWLEQRMDCWILAGLNQICSEST